MIVAYSSFVTVPGAVLVLILAWRLLNWIWLKPRKAEKLLRAQGLRGNSYRFLYGDVKEMSRMASEAKAKPINFTHDIVPRVLPFIHKIINTFVKGKYARVCIEMDLNKPLVPVVMDFGHVHAVEYEGFYMVCFSYGQLGHNMEQFPTLEGFGIEGMDMAMEQTTETIKEHALLTIYMDHGCCMLMQDKRYNRNKLV